jgi:hypothetical protein
VCCDACVLYAHKYMHIPTLKPYVLPVVQPQKYISKHMHIRAKTSLCVLHAHKYMHVLTPKPYVLRVWCSLKNTHTNTWHIRAKTSQSVHVYAALENIRTKTCISALKLHSLCMCMQPSKIYVQKHAHPR